VKHPVEIGTVDDRRGLSGAADRQVVANVEVARHIRVLARPRNAERVGTGRHQDRVGAGERIRLVDGGPQRAVPLAG
jgi:hypothetical protein